MSPSWPKGAPRRAAGTAGDLTRATRAPARLGGRAAALQAAGHRLGADSQPHTHGAQTWPTARRCSSPASPAAPPDSGSPHRIPSIRVTFDAAGRPKNDPAEEREPPCRRRAEKLDARRERAGLAPLPAKRLQGQPPPGKRRPGWTRRQEPHRAGDGPTSSPRRGPREPPVCVVRHADRPCATREAATARARSSSRAYPGASHRRARGTRRASTRAPQSPDPRRPMTNAAAW